MNIAAEKNNEGAPAPRNLRQRLAQFAHDGSKDHRWFVMNVFSRFYTIRRLVRLLSKNADLRAGPQRAGLFPSLDVDETVATLDRDGVCTGLQLPQNIVDRFVEYASTNVMRGDGQNLWGFTLDEKDRAEQEVGRRFGFANFLHLDEELPLIAEVGSDPKLQQIAAEYFGTTPMHVISRLWWNFAVPDETSQPGEVRRIASYFHHDKDGYAGLRLFFYLTDVDASAGPHVVVPGSHRKKSVRQILSIAKRSDDAIAGFYGSDALTAITGRAGSGFLEDPFCFHKGTAPTTTDRLILELQFATTRYSVFDKAPDRSELATIFEPPSFELSVAA
ncbi:MAG: phytanoyl-CoA dioxygenase family protein [Acidimicrobiia bacterium]|nr:phytanoyl-CoA dioxygenase family protein [Acidimicrobiia bacterium]